MSQPQDKNQNAAPVKQRSCYVDIMKGLLMFSVVAGHCLHASVWTREPHAGYIPYIFNTFDMPMFMAISGYFFFMSAARRTVGELLHNKLLHILLPCFIWGVLIGVLQDYYHVKLLGDEIGWFTPQYSLWFLWSLCICICLCIIPILIRKISELWSIIVTLLICVALCFIPNDFLPRNNYNVAYMFPFFYAGFLACRFKLTCKVRPYHIALCFILMIGMNVAQALKLFENHSVWVDGTYLLGPLGLAAHLKYTVVRMVLAFVGCGVFAGALWYAYKWIRPFKVARWWPLQVVKIFFMRVGEFSLAVYIMQSLVVETFFRHMMDLLRANGAVAQVFQLPCPHRIFNWVYLPICSVLAICICLVVIRLASQNRVTKLLLLGK